MTKRRKISIQGPPLTKSQLQFKKKGEYVPKSTNQGRSILCVKCGQGGGTLQRVGDGKYKHAVCPATDEVEVHREKHLRSEG